MTYDSIKTLSALAGLLIFLSLFVAILIYALWPANRIQFERARRIPLHDDFEKDGSHGR